METNDNNKKSKIFSRRTFLKGLGLTGAPRVMATTAATSPQRAK